MALRSAGWARPRTTWSARRRTRRSTFAGDGRGGFVVPEVGPAIDGNAAFLRLLGLVARTRLRLSQIDARIPEAHVLRREVDTPWAAKGQVMRLVLEAAAGRTVDTTDGLRIVEDDGAWALVLPGPGRGRHSRLGRGRLRGGRHRAARLLDRGARAGRAVTPPRAAGVDTEPRRDPALGLLDRLVRDALDQGYLEAASRREAAQDAAAASDAPGTRWLLALGLGLVALVVTVAAADQVAGAPDTASRKSQLAGAITEATTRVDGLETGVRQRTAEVAALRSGSTELGHGRPSAAGPARGSRRLRGHGRGRGARGRGHRGRRPGRHARRWLRGSRTSAGSSTATFRSW